MNRFVNILEKIQLTAGALSLLTFFVVIVIQIVTRHLGVSVIWTEEVANYSFIWAVFMGAAVMVNRRDHFTFDFLQRKLTGKPKLSLSIFTDSVLILFNIAIFYFGLQVVERFWNYNWAALPAMKMGYVWLSIPIMAGTMVIYSTVHLINHAKMLKVKEVNE
ncbi:TRAP transporter small permease subunit [Aquibacillus halophilus]|uniref:TRAP transporter small permease subunit n=1 Tax=Aquibacillus halophilus TaxID=930132 RepID=A0A6A8DTC7_9BACI|nr:TRAP transporter small permease [Aquibacillus halophilus]MRH44482.1 TRAP transporter small permease subunit [Aquibacillus halophilus]